MACTGAYATVLDFAAFWCVAGLDTGVDNSGGVGNAFLTDTTANFIQMGVEAPMIIQNVTDGSIGYIVNVTETTIVAVLTGGAGNDWDDGDIYRIVGVGANEFIVASDASAILFTTSGPLPTWTGSRE